MTTSDFEFAVRGGFHAVRVLRHHLAAWMHEVGVEPSVIDDVQLAVSELAANAIEASPLGEADIEGTADAEILRLTVTNRARHAFCWPRGHDGVGPDPESARGRGLQIASAITDTLDISTQRGCTRAVLTKHLVGEPAMAERTARGRPDRVPG
jgi:anti-sigma regulatory factor (Ser/Thr protein kinase)